MARLTVLEPTAFSSASQCTARKRSPFGAPNFTRLVAMPHGTPIVEPALCHTLGEPNKRGQPFKRCLVGGNRVEWASEQRTGFCRTLAVSPQQAQRRFCATRREFSGVTKVIDSTMTCPSIRLQSRGLTNVRPPLGNSTDLPSNVRTLNDR